MKYYFKNVVYERGQIEAKRHRQTTKVIVRANHDFKIETIANLTTMAALDSSAVVSRYDK